MTQEKKQVNITLRLDWVMWLKSKYGSVSVGIRSLIAEQFSKENR
jgi:hypothetical protein